MQRITYKHDGGIHDSWIEFGWENEGDSVEYGCYVIRTNDATDAHRLWEMIKSGHDNNIKG